MNAEHDEQLDAMLARSYESLRETVPGEREAIIAGLSQPQAADHAQRRRRVNGPFAFLATAAALAVVTGAIALLVPSSTRLVYGVEAVAGRLAEVKTIRLRGYTIIYTRRDADDPPVRVTKEFLIKRPDKFRFTCVTVSYPNDEPPIIQTGVSLCDGQNVSGFAPDTKLCETEPIGVLEAWINTEMHVQGYLTWLLGPPGMPYKKIGREKVDGRQCDVYEGRFGRRNEFEDKFISKLWIDPTTGYPVRSTQDEILPDSTTRRVQAFDKIEVNVPLDDKLFAPPEGFKVVRSKKVVAPGTLSSRYSSASYGGQEKVELWHAFRITDNTALIVWRRSAPEAADDGTSDWLSGVTLSVFGDERKRPVRHDWVYQSRSPDVWNWSLVAVDDGPLPDRGGVRLHFEGDFLDSRTDMVPLRFPELGLARIIEAASEATLPEDGPRFKLEHLRSLAGELTQAQPKP